MLFVVLERQRQAVVGLRVTARRALVALAQSTAGLRGTTKWPPGAIGDLDDDNGEEGGVIGSGWKHNVAKAQPPPPPDDGNGDAQASALRAAHAAQIAAERALVKMCAAASDACKPWRAAALHVVDRVAAGPKQALALSAFAGASAGFRVWGLGFRF